jgi:esterase/lipase superfamily enzyme
MRRMLVLFVCALVAGCGLKPLGLGGLSPLESNVAVGERVFVATTRAPDADKSVLFGGERSTSLHFADLTVSVPLNREPGTVKYPSAKPDAAREFAVSSIALTDDEAVMAAQLRSALAQKPKGERSIFIFVHGYNVSFAKGLFSTAQIQRDYRVRGLTMHYSWPSASEAALYLYDRDSAEFARDGLVRTLKIAEAANPESIILLAHSMGTFLTMEAMRTLALKGDNGPASKMEALVLAAPDIDFDVFQTQLAALKSRPKAMIVLVSEKDRALQISSRLRGGAARVGSGFNKDELTADGLVVLDVATLTKKGDKLSHSTFANSETLIKLVNGGLNLSTLEKAATGNPAGLVGETLGATGDLLSSIVYLPAKVVGAR